MKQTLRQAQEQLKQELETNNELKSQDQSLTMKQVDQSIVLNSSSEQLSTIRSTLKTYKETKQMKDDQSKFGKAVSNVQQAVNLEDLTMLALKITEQMKRAQINQQPVENGH